MSFDWQKYYEENPRPRVNNSGLTYGWGINDSDYMTVVMGPEGLHVYKCPHFSKWYHILERGYSQKYKNKFPSYEGVSVSEDWKYFSQFKLWIEKQNTKMGNEKLELDKDILIPGNKIYSPESCAFVPHWLNKSLYFAQGVSRVHPCGVAKLITRKGETVFQAKLVNDAPRGVGVKASFDTPEEAHQAWQLLKANAIEGHIARYRLTSCYIKAVDDAIMLRVDKLREDSANGIETKFIL